MRPLHAHFTGTSAAAIDREYETTWSERLERQPPEIRRDIEREHSQAKHVCHWLYKNMVMDATGRVIPCCAAPRPDADLVFAQFGGNGAEAFNSEKYRLARLSFADKEEFAQARGGSLLDRDPHCVTCDWYGDQAAAQIDSAQVSSYFRGAADGLFGDQSIGRLAGW